MIRSITHLFICDMTHSIDTLFFGLLLLHESDRIRVIRNGDVSIDSEWDCACVCVCVDARACASDTRKSDVSMVSEWDCVCMCVCVGARARK